MLREPTTWTISWYNHLMTAIKNKNPRWLKILTGDESLEEFLDNSETRIFFSNIQTRNIALDLNPIFLIPYLIKNRNCETRLQLPEISQIKRKINYQNNIPNLDLPFSKIADSLNEIILNDVVNFPSIEMIDPKIDEQKLFEIAKIRLEEMACFGILEYFRESLFMFCHIFDWEFPKEVPKENVGMYQNRTISDVVLKKIQKYNNLDFKLYNFAKDLFLKRVSMLNIS